MCLPALIDFEEMKEFRRLSECAMLGWEYRGEEVIQAGLPAKEIWRFVNNKLNQQV